MRLATPHSPRRTTSLSVLCAAVLGTLAACHSDPSSDAGAKPVLIKSIRLKGTTPEASAVAVDQQSDNDGVADRSWQASFQLDGKTGASSLPRDTGEKQTVVLDARGRRVSDNVGSRTRVTIVLGE